MQLTGILLESWLCHRRRELAIAPLTLLCGPNGTGKSAVRDAVSFVLLNELRRITAKGDRDQLLTEGTARGAVTLRFAGVEISRDVGTGKLTKAGAPTKASSDGLPYTLDPAAFGRLAGDDRRVALLRIMSVPIDTHTVMAELTVRGRNTKLLGSAFPHNVTIEKWHEAAGKALTEARGVWKGITGENYGCKKAESWRAPEPEQALSFEQYESAMAVCERAKLDAATWQRTLGAIDQATGAPAAAAVRDALQQQYAGLAAAQEAADEGLTLVTSAQHALEEADAHLADVASRQPGRPPDTCPHCGCEVMRRDGVLEPYVAPDDLATPGELATAQATRATQLAAALAARGRSVSLNTLAEAATNAGVQIASMRPGAETTIAAAASLPSRAEAEAGLHTAETQQTAAAAQVADYVRTRDAIADAQLVTRKAAEAHAKIVAWTLIVDDLAPAGIQQTLLGKALAPLNDRLRDLSGVFGWPQARVADDMAITIDGRAYGLRSESEQWRADAMIAVAIAALTGLRMVVLDRFDVLEVAARAPALRVFYRISRPGGMLDTCILLGTLKAAPTAPADVQVTWLGEAGAALQVAA